MTPSKMTRYKLLLLAASAAVGASATVTTASAQVDGTVEELVVTGSRGRPRTVQDSPVPIDVIPEAEIQASTYSDTNNVLQTLIPSYNVQRNPNSDAGSFVRPATLRGLPADKTLLLVNSKRRHRSAAVSAGGNGAQAADAAMIPSSAIKTVEVLRDGAAALYGSDAIAGVINFLLRDDDHGGSLSARYGQFYSADGDDVAIDGNVGLPLFDAGFINISAEYTKQKRTSRGTQFCIAAFCADTYAQTHPAYAAYLKTLDDYVGRIGQPKAEAIRGFINAGYTISDTSKLYAFANYSWSDTHADASYRYPGAAQQVTDTAVRLADGSIFKYGNQIYPFGFTPDYSGELNDYSIVGGWKGEWAIGTGLSYDLSARYGYDEMRYFTSGTVNASLGPDSPHDFMRAFYTSDEAALNADFGYEKELPYFASPLNMAFGMEYRKEGFTQEPGEERAYVAGPFAGQDPFDFCTNETAIAQRNLRATAPQNAGINCRLATDPVYATLPTLTLTVSPNIASDTSRDSQAAYFEASTDLTDKFFFDVATRYENFSDFGKTANWKVSGRYKILDNFALRGSVGTGFRAPTPGQQSFINSSNNIVDGVVTSAGLFPVTHPVAVFLGAKPLKPEKSFNIAGGMTATLFDRINLSVDYYNIEIEDQYYATSAITVTPAIRTAMIAAGVANAESISRVNFFQNAFDSKTEGLDIVATERFGWDNGQTTSVTLSFNYNKYSIEKTKIGNLFDAEAIFDFENGNPRWKAVASGNHEIGPFNVNLRGTLWGPYKNMFSATDQRIQKFDPMLMVDAEVSYAINEAYKVSVGVRNAFNKFPDPDRLFETTGSGAIYRTDSVVDWQGGFWFGRIEAKF
jgi:iron complex outermembrane receptor protein